MVFLSRALCIAAAVAFLATLVPAQVLPEISGGRTIYLRGWTGKYIDVEGADVKCRQDDRGKVQEFIIEKADTYLEGSGSISSGDAVYLKSHTGKHVDVEGRAVQCRWNGHGESQKLIIEKAHGTGPIRSGDAIYLRTHTLSYIDVEGSSVNARWNDRGRWQKLTIEMKALLTDVDIANGMKGNVWTSSLGECRGGSNSMPQYHSDRDCEARCDGDWRCTAYVLPTDGANWCKTYFWLGVTGSGWTDEKECFVKQAQSITLRFKPGVLGTLWEFFSNGFILAVGEGQAKDRGVKPGWVMKSIDGQPFSNKLLTTKIEAGAEYDITFIGRSGEVPTTSTTAATATATTAASSRNPAEAAFIGRAGEGPRRLKTVLV